MPSKPLRPCNKVGCNQLTNDTYCESHKQSISNENPLRVGFPPDISFDVLRDLSAKLKNENIKFNFVEAISSEQQSLLPNGELDVGVVYHPISEDGLWLSKTLFQTLGVVFSNQHPLRNRECIKLDELSDKSLYSIQLGLIAISFCSRLKILLPPAPFVRLLVNYFWQYTTPPIRYCSNISFIRTPP